MKRNTKRIGDISELRVMHDLVRAGYLVSIPFGEDRRYDIVIEKDGAFSRVQVKTGRLRNGVILFNCFSSHAHRGGASCRQYLGEIEFFGVYCPQLDSTYLIPIDEMPVQAGMLRVETAKNGQRRKLRWADRYLLFRGTAGVGKSDADEVPRLALETPL
ncbi:MAG TPA: group I intron-associated PD-(D/E)XK endonuclease [Candidatus Baltobacteraceae bacterium]|nr:group I intron-associated PD-(D/E)XK endonuclease [Candidatus Baltobacteraceae bacterium]